MEMVSFKALTSSVKAQWQTSTTPLIMDLNLFIVVFQTVLVVRIAYGCPYYKDPAIFHLFLKYHKWKIVYSLLSICLSASR